LSWIPEIETGASAGGDLYPPIKCSGDDKNEIRGVDRRTEPLLWYRTRGSEDGVPPASWTGSQTSKTRITKKSKIVELTKEGVHVRRFLDVDNKVVSKENPE